VDVVDADLACDRRGGRFDVAGEHRDPLDTVRPRPGDHGRGLGAFVVGEVTGTVPQLFATDQVREADAVITMGCGDVCPVFPGKRYEDWDLTGPAGKSLAEVRPIRDDIKQRVTAFVEELRRSPRA